MTKQTSKDQLLQDIRNEHRQLENSLSGLDEEAMTRPGIVGTWSVKDLLAHLTAWEQLFIDWYRTGLQGGIPAKAPVGMSRKAMDALNRAIYDDNRHRGLEEILAGFHVSYRQVLTFIEAIPEDELFAQGAFAWTGKLTLADYIAGNTCNHYAWARTWIRKQVRRAKR